MARISETEFYNDKDVITQIEWIKKNMSNIVIKDIELEQDTTVGSVTFGRVTMRFIMEQGDPIERYFDNTAVKEITSEQTGSDLKITFHLSNGQTYDVHCTITATATCSWNAITGTPDQSTSFTTYMNTNHYTKLQTDAAIGVETARATGVEGGLDTRLTAMDQRIDGIVSTLVGILYPVGSLYLSTNAINPGTFITGTTWELYSKGKCIIGQNPDDADYATLGATGGAKATTLTVGNLPAHAHDIVAVGNHSHNGGTDEQGYGKTGTMAFLGGESTEGKLGSHRTGTWDYGGVGSTRDMGYVQADNHSHSFTTSENGGHSHGCGNTGSGNPVDIRDPYVVVAIWKRTA